MISTRIMSWPSFMNPVFTCITDNKKASVNTECCQRWENHRYENIHQSQNQEYHHTGEVEDIVGDWLQIVTEVIVT